MKPVKFKEFITANKLKVSELPKPLIDKIDIFWKLYELLDSIMDTDRQELIEQLQQLDYEILGDIEQQYEEQLENNDRFEQLIKSPLVTQAFKEKVKQKIRTDITIIKELVSMGRTRDLTREELESMGLKTKLGKNTQIGQNTLRRKTKWFYYYYDIIDNKSSNTLK
ncbi:hypothetical protein HN014_10630 [Aquimarina sp. TRL1]|uniref:hypothetical protein n=1 Tax=Aquimarina sp. (strain TRL1) TaxID=2736252 RepID=UPI00158DE473|nr:hypothetical protein [Aquimarina sp. TRL1]QKX05351.1 hypothetical protein HN014_10630 [Aquimarina sp. TRL1]